MASHSDAPDSAPQLEAPFVYECPDCGARGMHELTCPMHPGEQVLYGNRVDAQATVSQT